MNEALEELQAKQLEQKRQAGIDETPASSSGSPSSSPKPPQQSDGSATPQDQTSSATKPESQQQ